MGEIVGHLKLTSGEDLYDFDWKSLKNGFNIFMKHNGWTVYHNENIYQKPGNNSVKISISEILSGYDIYITGKYYEDYSIIENVVDWIACRYIKVNGRIVVDITDTDKVDILLFKDNKMVVREGTF